MADEVTCDTCGKSFGSEQSLGQHVRAKHPEEVRSSGFRPDAWMPAFRKGALVLGLIFVGYGFYAWVLPLMNQPSLPTTSDHWHADYSIQICGESIPPLPYSQGDVHTHGQGRIHVHPHSPRTEGRNANLQAFFRSFGGDIGDTSLKVPGYGTYRNGEECTEGEPGTLTVYVNGSTVENPARYVPQDGDNVQIVFGPDS